ncbi:LptA/OstA family protein [Oryzibacter oryziterrae]|uniref:LptA/OstA family protein n=1 Tax=Oryzibacter oryziterrae TaxID=2766474 RepID=UPI001F229072|nr:LptA/OstA family protein [Oryzibacter oryziterrae]
MMKLGTISRQISLILAAGLLLGSMAAPGLAEEKQTAKLPKSYQGLGMSSNQPIQFEAESLEVRDQEHMAVFSGHVIVRQEQTVLKADTLNVYYQGSAAAQATGGQPSDAPATPGQGNQQVKRLEANGNVLVTSGQQTASGNAAVFDTTLNTIVLTGNVVLTQGDNVIRGARLVINVETSQAKMEGGRVQMLITPKSLNNNGG